MSKVIPQLEGKQDERLMFVLEQVKKATEIFVKAIRDSSDEHESLSFKAFTLKSDVEAEVAAIFDVIMTAVAIELKEQADDLITKFTFYNSRERTESGEHELYLHCRKVAPPTKEEVDKMVEAEEASKKQSEELLPIPEEAERCD